MMGETLAGKYSLERLLGEGGMGAVYQARNNVTGRRVAVKVITADLAKRPNVAKRFEIEARAAGAIESAYIAQILDAGEDVERGIPFIVMELLEGEDLEHILARLGALPQSLVVKLAAQVCLGLAKAHAAGVIHRDVKPANIFVAERDGGERSVKLLDFGVAKVRMEVASSDAKLTNSGNLVGSPRYMSPEQARGKSDIDQRTDVWSLGMVLFEALSAKLPHADSAGIGDLILAICTQPPPSVQTVAPWVGEQLSAIVSRALMMDPNERFQSIEQMYAALRSLSRESIAIETASIVSVSGNERMRLAPVAAGPWVPTGESLFSEEDTSMPATLVAPELRPAVGALDATSPGDAAKDAAPPSSSQEDQATALRVAPTAVAEEPPASELPTQVRQVLPGPVLQGDTLRITPGDAKAVAAAAPVDTGTLKLEPAAAAASLARALQAPPDRESAAPGASLPVAPARPSSFLPVAPTYAPAQRSRSSPIVVVLVVLALGGVGYFVWAGTTPSASHSSQVPTARPTSDSGAAVGASASTASGALLDASAADLAVSAAPSSSLSAQKPRIKPTAAPPKPTSSSWQPGDL